MAEVSSMKFWQDYGSYLLTIRKDIRDDEKSNYAQGTILQYLGVCKGYFSKKWILIDDFIFHPRNDPGPAWYDDVYSSLKDAIKMYRLLNELGLSEQGATLSKATFMACVKSLLMNNLITGVSDRLALTIAYHAVGRCSELAYITYRSMILEADSFGINWAEIKTDHSNLLSFYASCDGYLLCVLNSIACDLIMGNGNSQNSQANESFILPSYGGLALGGCANKLSNVLKKGGENGVLDLTKKGVSSHAVRRSAFNFLAGMGGLINYHQLLARSGHEDGGASFVYLYKNAHQQVAGKLLAGVHDPNKAAPSPNLDVITEDSEEISIQAENLISEMFETPIEELKVGGNLRPFLRRCLASLLHHYKAMLMDLKSSNIVVKKITSCAQRVGWDISMLVDFSEKIEADFEAQKLINMAGSNIEVNALMKIGQENRNEIKSLKDMVLLLVSSNEELRGEVRSLRTVMEQREQRARNSPSKKSPSKAPQPPPIGTREEEEEEESSSSSSSSSSSTEPTVNTTLFKAPALVAKNFEGCGSWAPLKLMQEFVSQHVDFTSPNYGFVMKPGLKANNKKVIDEMLKFATEVQLTSLKHVRGGNLTNTSTRIQDYKAACVDIQKKMVDDLMHRESSIPSETKAPKTTTTDGLPKKSKTKKNSETGGKVTVTSIARRLQSVAAAETKSTLPVGQTILATFKRPKEDKEKEGEEEDGGGDDEMDVDTEGGGVRLVRGRNLEGEGEFRGGI
jgi:hypothetical protein